MNLSFSRKTDLALTALRVLAEKDGTVTRKQLAREVGTTPSYLPQVMAPLVRAGWVDSGRGPGGGYALDPSAYQTRALDVLEATEGPAETGRCVMRDTACPGTEACPFHPVWTEARRVLLEGLDAIPVVERGEMR
jgi:Rrf2 family protein